MSAVATLARPGCSAPANRDEDAFRHADEIVPDRRPNRHLTFGIGLHRCIGAPIASAEIRIALEAVLGRLPDYVIDVDALHRADTVGIVFGHFSDTDDVHTKVRAVTR